MTDTFASLRQDPEFRRDAGKAFAKGMIFVILFFILLFGWMFLRADDTLMQWQERFASKTVSLQVAPTPVAAIGLSDADRITPTEAAPTTDAPIAQSEATPKAAAPASYFNQFRKAVPLAEGKAHIAIVLTNLGIAESFSKNLIETLPQGVTLGFSPYATKIDVLKASADSKGFESWLMLPLEPADYPARDPGPMTVLTNASLDATQEHITRLTAMAQMGYPGFISNPDHVFSDVDLRTNPLLKMIAEKGFGFAEGRNEGNNFAKDFAAQNFIPYAQAGDWLGRNMGRTDIQAVLQRVEKLAQLNGNAVLMVEATPLSSQLLKEWMEKLPGMNIQLVPLSVLAQ